MSAAKSVSAPLPEQLHAPEESSPLFTYFDEQASRSQASYYRAFFRSLYWLGFISIISAMLGLGGLLKQQLPHWTRLFDVGEAIGLVLTTVAVLWEFHHQRVLRKQLSPWIDARNHAELLRSAVWLYLFDLPMPSPTAPLTNDEVWRNLTQTEAACYKSAEAIVLAAAEPTPALQALRHYAQQLTLPKRLHNYCTHRLETQRSYFVSKAKIHRDRAKRNRLYMKILLTSAISWNVVRLVLLTLSLAYPGQWLSGAVAFFNGFNCFLLLISFVGLFKAYTEGEDLEPLAARYSAIGERLAEHSEKYLPTQPTEAQFQRFVEESELMLRDETIEWATRRSEPISPVAITVGFVGKRILAADETALSATLATVFDDLEREFPGPVYTLVGLSALAMGADTLFAELVGSRGATTPLPGRPSYSQRVFLPTPPAIFFLPADFRLTASEPESIVAARLERAAACLHAPTVQECKIMGISEHRDEQFAETAFAIVQACHLLLVACTQAEKNSVLSADSSAVFHRGGSAETLRHAHALGKRLIIIETDAPTGPTGQLPTSYLPAASNSEMR